MRRLTSLMVATDTGLWLFAVAMAIGCFRVYQLGPTKTIEYSVVSAVPATATIIYALASLFAPNLTGDRFKAPQNLTGPMVYTSLLLSMAILWTTDRSSFAATPAGLRVAQLWLEPKMLIASWVAGTALLTLRLAFRPKKKQ